MSSNRRRSKLTKIKAILTGICYNRKKATIMEKPSWKKKRGTTLEL
jgi:hypothetical protein